LIAPTPPRGISDAMMKASSIDPWLKVATFIVSVARCA
jgi:hypothetical protein